MNDRIQLGLNALAAGDGHEALECFTRILNDEPRNASAFFHRAQVHLLLNDRPKAIADLDAAIRIQPKNLEFRIRRAGELFKQRQFERTIEDCDAGLALDSSRQELLALRGRSHVALGNSTAALKDFEAAGPSGATLYAALLAELGECRSEDNS